MRDDRQTAWEVAGASQVLAAKLAELEADTEAERGFRGKRQARMERRLRDTANIERIRELSHALADLTVAYDRIGEQSHQHVAAGAISGAMRSVCDQINHSVRALDDVDLP